MSHLSLFKQGKNEVITGIFRDRNIDEMKNDGWSEEMPVKKVSSPPQEGPKKTLSPKKKEVKKASRAD